MKLKLDENIDPRAKEILTQAGHDVLSMPEEALSGVSDDVLGAVASREERCLLTLDMDFANIFAYPPERYAGLVVLRHPHPTVKGLLNLVHQFTISLSSHNPRGQLWIVEPGRLRIHEETEASNS